MTLKDARTELYVRMQALSNDARYESRGDVPDRLRDFYYGRAAGILDYWTEVEYLLSKVEEGK